MFTYSVKKNIGENVRGQARLIHTELAKLGTATSGQLTKAVADRLETRQDPARVVGYYLIIFHKKGLVARTIVADAPEVIETAASETIADAPNAEVENMTEAQLEAATAPETTEVEVNAPVENGAPGEVVDETVVEDNSKSGRRNNRR